MPKIITNSFKESFLLIWKNKSLFVLLFILQVIFFIVLSLLTYQYVPKIVESQRAIMEYMGNLKIDEDSIASNVLQQKNILGDDPLSISRNFNEMVKNFRLYLVYAFMIVIFFIALNWTITVRLIHKTNFKKLTRIFLKILIISLFYLALIFSFFFSMLNISLTEVAAESTKLLTKYVPFFIFSIILLYFMFISISLLHKTKLNNIVQKTLRIGIKKAHYILSVYFVNIFLLSISIFLLYYFIEKNLFVLLLSIFLMIFSFVFGRIFLVKVVEKLD